MNERSNRVAIAGGGLVGSLLSVFLVRRGLEVTVYESRQDPRTVEGAGRSINLVVTSRGIEALRAVGLAEKVFRLTVPVMGRMMHQQDGELYYQPYGKDDAECNYSVSRAGLNRLLVAEAEQRGVRFRFERGVTDVDFDGGFIEVAGAERIAAPVLFGADGAASAVRAAMAGRPGFEDSAELLSHGYKELVIPAAADGGYRIEKNALHIWPRGELMLMALPDLEGSFTVTLYLPTDGPGSFAELDRPERVRGLFEEQFSDAIPLIPDLEAAFLANPVGVLGTVRSEPWNVDGSALLIGDAAHAIVPFFGQGMNCGFEDCAVLEGLLDRVSAEGWEPVFDDFSRARKTNADAIADMALENFVEMRDRVGDEAFLLRKAVEHRLEQVMPREYRSRYSMVMYSSIPYRVCFDAGLVQQQLLAELCRGLSSADELDLDRARKLVRERLTPFLERHGVSLDY